MAAAAPSETGELSNRLIGGAIIAARLYTSSEIARRNIAFGLFTALRCALIGKGANASCGMLYSCM